MEEDDEEANEISPELAKLTKELGVKIGTPYDKPDRVERVRFSFNEKTWADLANKEGELLPTCCASISSIRDAFISAMRENGWMDCNSMQSIVFNMSSHDFEQDHPVSKVVQVYEKLKEHLHFTLGVGTRNLDNVHDVCSLIKDFCLDYWSNSMFDNWGESANDVATHNRAMFQIFPAIKALAAKFDKMALPPVEGYALVRKSNKEVCEMRRGMAIFSDKDDAEKVLADWLKTKQIDPDIAEIMPIRVSWEKGIEFISEVKNPFVHLPKR